MSFCFSVCNAFGYLKPTISYVALVEVNYRMVLHCRSIRSICLVVSLSVILSVLLLASCFRRSRLPFAGWFQCCVCLSLGFSSHLSVCPSSCFAPMISNVTFTEVADRLVLISCLFVGPVHLVVLFMSVFLSVSVFCRWKSKTFVMGPYDEISGGVA